jgi:hypothetical protein
MPLAPRAARQARGADGHVVGLAERRRELLRLAEGADAGRLPGPETAVCGG